MDKVKKVSRGSFRGRNVFYEPKKPTHKPFIMKCLSGGGDNLYAIYPDTWKKQWGAKPLLGYVWSSSEYWAYYDAYDKKLLQRNDSFEPHPIKVEVEVCQPTQPATYMTA
jgi:hypothetical protein